MKPDLLITLLPLKAASLAYWLICKFYQTTTTTTKHSARYTALTTFFVSFTCYKTSFARCHMMTIKNAFSELSYKYFIYIFFPLFLSFFFFYPFRKRYDDLKVDCKGSWWIHVFVGSAIGKTGMVYHPCWNVWVIHSWSAISKIKDYLRLAFALICLLKLIVENQVKTLILTVFS